MKPDVPIVLAAAARHLDNVARKQTEFLEMLNLQSLRTFLTVIDRDWDECVTRRLEEINSLCNLLARGVEVTSDPVRELLAQTVKVAKQDAGNLRIFALDATLSKLLAALIELQTFLETNPTDEAQALLTDTWLFLDRSTRRRVVDCWWF